MRYIIPHHSYATASSCTYSNGAWYYPSSTAKGFQVDFTSCAGAKEKYDAVHGIGTATGSRNADRTKLNTPKGNGTISTLHSQYKNLKQEQKDSKLGSLPSLPSLGGGGGGGGTKDPGVNPDSGCHNCGPDAWYSFLDPAQWGCKLNKIGCEWGVAAGKGFDGISKWLGDNAIWIAGGGIFAIVFLSVILKQM